MRSAARLISSICEFLYLSQGSRILGQENIQDVAELNAKLEQRNSELEMLKSQLTSSDRKSRTAAKTGANAFFPTPKLLQTPQRKEEKSGSFIENRILPTPPPEEAGNLNSLATSS